MRDAAAQARDGLGQHLVLYDGVCGLCSRLVQFLLARDRHGVFDFASLQSATGSALVEQAGGNPGELTSFYVVENYRTPQARAFTRGRAALFVAGELGWPWKLLRVLAVLPTTVVDCAYDSAARWRYALFGRRAKCLVPAPEFRRRFIDW